jgi:hypothetical protein
MRLIDLQRRKRADLAWFAGSVVAMQLALAVAVEQLWPAIRDPEYDEIEQIVRARVRAAPGRPLVLALGSSRTQTALAAQRLNYPEDASAPVVINAGLSGACAMMHQIALRRLMRAGLKPQMVFIEVMPMALSARGGASVEERFRHQGRHTLGEVVRLWKYYGEHYRLCSPWLFARVAPSYRYQAELRSALHMDLATSHVEPRDDYGWMTPQKISSRAEIAMHTRNTLEFYASALTQPAVSPGALRALRDLVQLCHDRHIAVALIVPAEGTPFRSFAPEVEETHLSAARQLAYEMAVPLIDARTWVDDDGFWDGHHTTERGAIQYTDRFARDALEPQMHRSGAALSASR